MNNHERRLIAKAMRNPDDWVIRIGYCDRWGDETERLVSPIKFEGQTTVLTLCLGRESPRRFVLENITSVSLVAAGEVLMPEPVTPAKRAAFFRTRKP